MTANSSHLVFADQLTQKEPVIRPNAPLFPCPKHIVERLESGTLPPRRFGGVQAIPHVDQEEGGEGGGQVYYRLVFTSNDGLDNLQLALIPSDQDIVSLIQGGDATSESEFDSFMRHLASHYYSEKPGVEFKKHDSSGGRSCGRYPLSFYTEHHNYARQMLDLLEAKFPTGREHSLLTKYGLFCFSVSSSGNKKWRRIPGVGPAELPPINSETQQPISLTPVQRPASSTIETPACGFVFPDPYKWSNFNFGKILGIVEEAKKYGMHQETGEWLEKVQDAWGKSGQPFVAASVADLPAGAIVPPKPEEEEEPPKLSEKDKEKYVRYFNGVARPKLEEYFQEAKKQFQNGWSDLGRITFTKMMDDVEEYRKIGALTKAQTVQLYREIDKRVQKEISSGIRFYTN